MHGPKEPVVVVVHDSGLQLMVNQGKGTDSLLSLETKQAAIVVMAKAGLAQEGIPNVFNFLQLVFSYQNTKFGWQL